MRNRDPVPNPTIDRLEEDWWNQNAETVEAVWAQPESIRPAVRNGYLKRAKEFFINSNKKPLAVLEVGCGSGWVGRMIADGETIKIVGIDLSEKQIEIARQNAVQAGLEKACEYYCQNLADFVMNQEDRINCVLIHAILHHLSWQEIHAVLNQIAALGSQTRVFVYEPVYLEKKPNGKKLLQQIYKKIGAKIGNIPTRLAKRFLRGNERSYDRTLADKVDFICGQAQQNGWVLSPKEVVFPEAELLEVLNQYFQLHDRYLCNYTSFTVGQMAAMYDDPELHSRFSRIVLPLSRYIDRFLFATNILPKIAQGYVFMGYECIVK